MSVCERCGKQIMAHRWLTHEVPVKKAGIKYLCTGYYTDAFEYPICDRCSEEFKEFMRGEAIQERTCHDVSPDDWWFECSECGAAWNWNDIQGGNRLCGYGTHCLCGARIVEEVSE